MKLFLDISSSCTGYALAEESPSEVTIHKVGVIWFPKEFTTKDKCYFMYRFILEKDSEYEYGLEAVVFETYSFNMKNPNGALVCPQLQGAILAACSRSELETDDLPPQTWRKQCGLKKKREENWKKVTEAHFRAIYDIPKEIESNITGRMRTVPSDYFDALGVCEGWYRQKGYRKFKWNVKSE